MTPAQVYAQDQARFAAEAAARRPPSPESLKEMFVKLRKRFETHPEEVRELFVKAGIHTRTGRLTKPYRELRKRDLEEAALGTAHA